MLILVINFGKVVVVLLLIFIITFTLLSHRTILKFVYPIKYEEIIVREAKKYNLDPYLVISIIYVESKFNLEATSNKGARGLMQIMPETGKWIAEMINANGFHSDMLYNPEINIKYGTWYIAKLKNRFNDNIAAMLAAYNGGEGNVDKWLKNRDWDGSHANLDQIPFLETREYVHKVKKIYSRYRYIYER
ncbi:lytic transglycosylase domain-containing protein [Orenia marismortui]|uniref:lytic transglycosylase domain-containing protein n=1 Tax=Orenia marismortui TaxID=46469 RepID=UPI001FBA20F8|nr:lytic transglycosylase domain-containing protein [Orenia marismortui]